MTNTVLDLLSNERLAPYLREADQDETKALGLYRWNTKISAACMEVLAHLEVLLRNAIDRELAIYAREDTCQIPWFMLPRVTGASHSEIIATVEATRARLRGISPNRDTRGQIIANVSFGFWTELFKHTHEDLWRNALSQALPGTPQSRRKNVTVALERTRKFRNRLAHHDSLLSQDILLHLNTMLDLVEWIDPPARAWLADLEERVVEIYDERPVRPVDTLVVPAAEAWPLYERARVYICPSDRNFRPATYIAFYADKEIKPEVPAILHHRVDVEWTPAEAARLTGLAGDAHRMDRKIAAAITTSHALGWPVDRFQVFILSTPGDSRHISLKGPVPHTATGRGSAFVQRHRYVPHHKLETATSTTDLI